MYATAVGVSRNSIEIRLMDLCGASPPTVSSHSAETPRRYSERSSRVQASILPMCGSLHVVYVHGI
jgi:hypothetical protein